MEYNDQENILFDSVDVDFELNDSYGSSSWLRLIAQEEKKSIEALQYIFCSDDYLLNINKEYLNHDNYTDIITFPYATQPIRSDIFISIDRVKENADTFKTSFENELNRVMAHGLLHLCGYKDKTKDEKTTMRSKENLYLSKV